MNDGYFIDLILREIEQSLNWEQTIVWTDSDYKRLSLLIFEKTNISISPQTLKRLFGKVKYKEIYTPQPATRDALAMFLGYRDWQAYISKKKKQGPWREKFSGLLPVNRLYRKILLTSTLGIVGVALITILFIQYRTTPVTFYAENLTGVTPHTVSIHYDVSKVRGKSVFIDFDQFEAEESKKLEKLDRSRKLINHCFESPGYYTVRLWIDNKVQASVKVHVLSDGWTSYYFNDDNFSLRKFIFGLEKKVNDTIADGHLYISPKDLIKHGFNGNTVYYLEHLQFREFGISADSCVLEVKYKNDPDSGGISCFDVEFRLIGENGLASIMLVQEGCYRWSEVTVGEVHLNGKFNDLTKLSSDMASWNVMRFEINYGMARVINGKDTIFTCSYLQPIGLIKGIRFVTKGSGNFEYVRLYNNHGELKYEDDFTN